MSAESKPRFCICVMCEITGLENQEMCHKCRVKWA